MTFAPMDISTFILTLEWGLLLTNDHKDDHKQKSVFQNSEAIFIALNLLQISVVSGMFVQLTPSRGVMKKPDSESFQCIFFFGHASGKSYTVQWEYILMTFISRSRNKCCASPDSSSQNINTFYSAVSLFSEKFVLKMFPYLIIYSHKNQTHAQCIEVVMWNYWTR